MTTTAAAEPRPSVLFAAGTPEGPGAALAAVRETLDAIPNAPQPAARPALARGPG